MAETLAFKYRAFISYSHADTSWAKWLHRALEGFRIDKDLVGRETATGTIPKTLRPIFRDRDDFTAGHALTDQTRAALDASAALIVLCSPHSARSEYVTEEIRLFKSRHPERPVIPLIVGGTPGDETQECFPKSLRCKLDDDGQTTEEPIELLAADAREEGDGKQLALAKVVAGLLGVSSDDIFRRAERERRKRQRNWIAGLASVALVLAGLSVWAEINRREAVAQRDIAERNFEVAKQGANALIFDIAQGLREQEGMGTETVRKILGTAEKAIEDLVSRSKGNLELLRLQAIMLNEFAQTYAAQADTARQEDAAVKALAIFERLAAAEPSNPKWQHALAVSSIALGQALRAQGDLPAARQAFQDSLDIAERLAKAGPGNAEWQRALAVSDDHLGNVAKAQGDLHAALKSYRDGLAIAARLAQRDPGNTEWQRDLSVSHIKIGDVLRAQGDLESALNAYQDSLGVSADLAEADPGNTQWWRDVSVSHERIGDVAKAQGDLAGALKAYSDSLAISERLGKSDPSNAGWQRDIAVGYDRIGDVLSYQYEYDAAKKAYQDSLAIKERLAGADPNNTIFQHDLSVSYERLGDVLRAQGDLVAALQAYQDSLAVSKRLAQADPGNAEWQRDLADIYRKLGHMFLTEEDHDAATNAYRHSLIVHERLVETAPSNTDWQRELALGHLYIGKGLAAQGDEGRALDVLRKGRLLVTRLKEHAPDDNRLVLYLRAFDADLAGALKAYEEKKAIISRLAAADPDNADRQRDLAASYQKVGDVLWRQGDLAGALKAYRDRLAIARALVAKDPSNAQWQEDLSHVVDHIGALVYAFVVEGDFRQALEAADEALAVAPDRIFIHGNRAHALMFLDRGQEAKAIYLRYHGQDKVLDNRSWDTLVKDDFVELRKEGRDHVLMDEIVAAFDKKDEGPATDEPAQAAP